MTAAPEGGRVCTVTFKECWVCYLMQKKCDVLELGFLSVTTRCHYFVITRSVQWHEYLESKLYSPKG